MEESNEKIAHINDDTATYTRVITVEEDLINKWLFSMIRGEHTFLTPPDEDGQRWVAIKITDVIAEFDKFKEAWDNRDA